MSAHTQGLAHLGQADTDTECVVFVGDRQIGELYEDGEVQTEEDQANAREVVKRWNAYPKLVATLRGMQCQCSVRERDSGHRTDCSKADVDAQLREIEGAT